MRGIATRPEGRLRGISQIPGQPKDLSEIGEAIAEAVGSLERNLQGAAVNVAGGTTGLGSLLSGNIANVVVSELNKNAGGIIDQLTRSLTDQLTRTISNHIDPLTKPIIDKLANTVSGLVDRLTKSLIDQLTKTAEGVTDQLTNTAQGLIDQVTRTLIDRLAVTAKDLLNQLTKALIDQLTKTTSNQGTSASPQEPAW